MCELSFHRLCAEDCSSVQKIAAQSFLGVEEYTVTAHDLTLPTHHWYVGKSNSNIVAYGGFMSVATDAQLLTIAVHPSFRHRGISTQFLRFLVEQAWLYGATALTLEVRASNTTARQLYLRSGFMQIDVRKQYYTHPAEDAVVLCKTKD